MADKQGNGQSLPRYYFDLGALSASMAGSFGEAIVPQGSVASGGTDSGNPLKVGGVYRATLPTLADGQRGDLQMGTRGSVNVTIVQQNGTSAPNVGNNASDGVAATTVLDVAAAVRLWNGASFDRLAKASSTSRVASAAASTNGTSAKASAGTVYTVDAVNTSAATKFLKLYNKASAPTVGTDTPILTIALPPTNASRTIEFPSGIYFSAGIAYALTGAAADSDTTALAAGDVVGLNITYG